MNWQTIWEAIRFLIVGIGNTLLGLTAIFVCLRLEFGDVVANALGYALGLVFSFFANRTWTFRHSGSLWPAFWRFIAVFALAYSVNLATVLALLKLFGNGSFLAQALGILPYTAVFFLGSRLLVFKQDGLQRGFSHGNKLVLSKYWSPFPCTAANVFFVLFAQFLLLASVFPLSELLTEKPLFYIDSSFHWFEISQAQALWREHQLVGYNPWFGAGYTDGINYNISAKFPTLLAVLFPQWLTATVAYKLYSFGSAWLAPACVPLAMRLLRIDNTAISLGTVLGLLLWWLSGLHWYHTAGMVSYVFSCYAVLPYIGLVWRGISGTLEIRNIIVLAVLGAAGLAYHPLFPIPIVFCLPLMILLLWHQVKPRQLFMLLILLPPLCVLPNLSWILPSLQHGSFASSSQPFQKAVDISLVWLEALGYIEGNARGAKLNPILWFFALVGIGIMQGVRCCRTSLVFILAAAALLVFAAVGAALPLVGSLQPNRLSMAAYLLLVIPAGIGGSVAMQKFAAKRFSWVPKTAVFVVLGLISAFFSKEMLGELSRADKPHYGARPPEVRGLGDGSLWLLNWLGHNTNSGARILFETSLGRVHDGAHMAGFLALSSQREFIGGPYVFMHYAGFWDGFLFGRKISDFSSGEFADRLALYNIGWIIVHSKQSKEYIEHQPGIQPLAEYGAVKVYGVEKTRSFFLEGTGRVVGRDFNRLDLEGLSGASVTLKYHFVPGLSAYPPIRLEPVYIQDDPIPFVRMIAPPSTVTLKQQ